MRVLILMVLSILASNCSSNIGNPEKMLREKLESGEDIYFENEVFNEDIDLTDWLSSNLVSEGIYQVRVNSPVTFKNCTFNGKVSSYKRTNEGKTIYTAFQSNLSFIGCTFNEEINLRTSSVLGRCDFTGSYFEKKANFEECVFFQNAYFKDCAFHQELRFQNAVFMQKAHFMNLELDENGSFQGATFHMSAQFSNLKSFGYADFSLVNWKDACFFNYAEFNDRSVFNNATFMHWAGFNKVRFAYAEMKNCRFFGQTSLEGASVDKQIVFTGNFFLMEPPDMKSIDRDKLTLE